MSPDTAQTLNFLQSDIGAAAVVIGVSILMWAAGFIIQKTRILPVWLAWVSFLLAVVARLDRLDSSPSLLWASGSSSWRSSCGDTKRHCRWDPCLRDASAGTPDALHPRA
jgi:hypothetical protein